MNSTAMRGEDDLSMAEVCTSKAAFVSSGNRSLVRRCEAGWSDVITKA